MDQKTEIEIANVAPLASSGNGLVSVFHRATESSTRNVALILGASCVLVSIFLKWINSPLGKDPRGLSFRIAHDLPSKLQPHWDSFGAAAILLLAAGLICWNFRPSLLRWIAVALLALALLAPMQLAFSTPSSLRQLTSEFHQYAQIRSFAANYLPVNKGREPTLWPQLETDTIWDRLASSWYFLSLGWCVFSVGAITTFAAVVIRQPKGRTGTCIQTLMILSALALLFIWKPARAQAELQRAYLDQARGDNEKAITHYENAISLDRWYALGPEIYARIGQLHERLGSLDTPEHEIYQAACLEDRDLRELAVFHYQRAQSAPEPISEVARKEAARTLVALGLELYKQQAISTAVQRWEQAIQVDPLQLQAHFYLTRAYFQLAQYGNSVIVGEQFCRRISNVFVVANVYSNLGDSYTQLQDFVKAREYYSRSFKLDANLNNRALRALVGD